MAIESWITPEETPALAEAATAVIEERLDRFGPAARAAYWASVRKCYNTPYNPPVPKAVAVAAARRSEVVIPLIDAAPIEAPVLDLPLALPALAAAAAATEVQAA